MRGFTRLLQTAVLLLFVVGQALGGVPSWSVINYTNSTTITGQNFIAKDTNGVAIAASAGDYIGVFVGTECRMKTTLFSSTTPSAGLYISGVIQGGYSGDRVTGEPINNDGEELTFVLYKTATNEQHVLQGTTFSKPGDHIDLYPIGKPNTGNDLKSLAITGATIKETFASGTTSYTASASSLPALSAIAAIKADSRAKVKITNATDLSSSVAADRTVTIVVTAEDGTPKTYTIVYDKAVCTVAAPTTAATVKVCANDAPTAKVLTATGLTGATFTWYSDAAKTNKLITADTYVPTVSGTYYVAQKTAVCEGAVATVVYTENANPKSTITGNLSYCGDAGVQLDATSDITATSEIFAKGATTPLVNPFKAGTYYAVATTAAGCKGTSAEVTVKANASSYTIVKGNDVCKGDKATAELTLDGAAPFALKYSINGTETSVNVTANTYKIESATTAAGSVEFAVVSLVDANSCPATSTSSTASVAVKEPTKLSVTPTDACDGENAKLTATGVSTGAVVTWTSTADAVLLNDKSEFTSDKTVDVKVYQTVAGCKSEPTTAKAIVNPKPTVSVSLANTTVCKADAAQNFTFVPATGGILTIDGTTSTATSFDPKLNDKGIHTITYSYTNDKQCTASQNLSVTVNEATAPEVEDASLTIMIGETIPSFKATGTSLSWKDENKNKISTSASFTPDIVSTKIGNYTYTVSNTENGCESSPVTVTLAVTDCKTSISVDKPTQSVCFGLTNPTFTASGAQNYQWYDAAGNKLVTTAAFIPTVTAVGTYTFKVSTSTCESAKETVTLDIKALPTATISTLPSVCKGATLSLTQYGAGTFTGTDVTANIFTATTVGSSDVTLTVTDANNCVATAKAAITVKAVPSAPVITVTEACEGSESSLTAAGTTIQWYTSAGVEISEAKSSQVETFYATQTVDGCTSEKASKATVINAAPTAPGISDMTIGTGVNTATLTATIEAGASLEWFNEAGTSIGTGDNKEVTIVKFPAKFSVKQTSVKGCVSTAANFQVSQSSCTTAAPTVDINQTSICADATAKITATGTGLIWYNNTTNAQVSTEAVYNAGVGTWAVSSTENGCEGPKTVVVVSAKQVIVPTVTSTKTSVRVSDDAFLLTVTPANGTFNDAAASFVNNIAVFNPADATVGTHSIIYTVNTECGAKSSEALVITVLDADISALTKQIQAVKDYVGSSTFGTSVDNFYPESEAPIIKAIADAEAIAQQSGLTGPQITKALADLNAAFDALKASIVKYDLTALVKKIKTATDSSKNVGTTKGTHSQSDVDDLIKAINAAKAVYSNPTSDAQVSAAVTALQKAIDDFAKTINTGTGVNIVALEITIAAAKDSAKNVGTTPGTHLQADVNTLTAAIAKAELAKTSTNQDVINAAKLELQTAIDVFAKTIILDTKVLDATIAAANDSALKVGTAVGQYPQSAVDVLNAAIAKAETAKSTATTQSQINAANAALLAAITEFATHVIKGTAVDLSELVALIARANDSTKKVGTAKGLHDQADVNVLKTAISKAEAAKSAATTQGQVSTAVAELQKAIEDFTKTAYKADVTALVTAIAKLEAKIAAISKDSVGAGYGKYTQFAIDAANTALTAAKAALEAAKTNASDVASATNAANTALATLIAAKSTKPDAVKIVSTVTPSLGATSKLAVVTTPEGLEDAATWSSSDEKVAIVNSKGQITFLAVGTVTITVNVNGTTASIEYKITSSEELANINVFVYPNPTASLLNISGVADAASLEITLIGGGTQAVSINGNETVTVDVASWAAGTYVVSIVTKDGKKLSSKFEKR